MSAVWSIPGAQAMAWSLVHFLWQGTLIAAGLAAALALVGNRSARLRHGLAAGALLLLLAAPAVTFFRLQEPATPEPGAGMLRGVVAAVVWESQAAAGPDQQAATSAAPGLALPVRLKARLAPLLPAILAAWLLGISVLSLWNLGGWLQAQRLARRATRQAPAPWPARCAALCGQLGIRRRVDLLASARVAVPSLVGWLRPVILVPAGAFLGLAPQQLEAVLLHELAHVRRHDALINLLQTVVETLFFYHPAVWWVSRQIRIAREDCCDDVALAACGDRLGYARALADLEGLRTPSLALAASGGLLLARIRRIVGAPAPRAARPGAWLTGAVALALLVGSATVHRGAWSAAAAVPQAPEQPARPAAPARPERPATPPAPARPAQPAVPARPATPATPATPAPPAAPAAPALAAYSVNSGRWTAERRKDGIQLEIQIREESDTGRHVMDESSLYAEKELVGLGAGPDVRFELRRPAGTFYFIGRLENGEGGGTFTFKGDLGFVKDMASLGYKVKNENLLQLALFDVSPALVRELRDLGYNGLPLERIVEFRIHGIDTQFIRNLAATGYRSVPPERLIELRIHGVDPDLIRALQELKVGDLTPESIIELKIHGTTPDYLRQMAAAGYRGLAARDVIQLRIHGISPDYVRDLAAAGYPNVKPDDLVRMRIHGVSADFIREQAQKGRRNLSIDELIELRIRGGR